MKSFSEYFKASQNPSGAAQGKTSQQPKAVLKSKFKIQKSNDDRMLAFGWANVSLTEEGEQIEDWQQDMIDPEVLEDAAYQFVELYREGGEMHERGGAAVFIESVVFTEEKMKALGIPEGTLPFLNDPSRMVYCSAKMRPASVRVDVVCLPYHSQVMDTDILSFIAPAGDITVADFI